MISILIADHLNKLQGKKLLPGWAIGWGLPSHPTGIHFEKAALTLTCVGFGIQKTLELTLNGDRQEQIK